MMKTHIPFSTIFHHSIIHTYLFNYHFMGMGYTQLSPAALEGCETPLRQLMGFVAKIWLPDFQCLKNGLMPMELYGQLT